eukprot:3625667-Amphidinium_carterae.7
MEDPEADAHGSDLFASAELENIVTPSSPAVQLGTHAIARAQRSFFNFRDSQYGKIRRRRPRQLRHVEKGDDGESRLILLLTVGNEIAAWSRKRCNICKNTDYPMVLSRYIDPDRHYPQCGATTTIGGAIVCLKCTRRHIWPRAENWLIQSREDAQKAWSVLH